MDAQNTEKLPGHLVLMNAATAITGEPVGRLDDQQKALLLCNLRSQCFVRKDDIVPKEELEIVITEVINAVSAVCDQWPDEVRDFVASQVGRDTLEIRAEEKGYVCVNHPTCKGRYAIVTPRLADKFSAEIGCLAEFAEITFNGSADIGDFLSRILSGGRSSMKAPVETSDDPDADHAEL